MPTPTISILIPCRNEEQYISAVLDNILVQDYPSQQMEVFVIDGKSTDATAKIVDSYAQKYPMISLLHNEAQYVPNAMNLGIQRAQGALIIRLDAHAAYPPDYVSKLVHWSLKTNAENVGGAWVIATRNNSLKAQAIALVLGHRLGVGNATYRIGEERDQSTCLEVDTVPFGCFPKRVFEEIGPYDLRLQRNQDIEFNKRIKANGGKILLAPDIQCSYLARDNFKDLWANNFANGDWVIRTVRYTQKLATLSLRHFIPLAFVSYLLLLFFFALWKINMLFFLFSLPLLCYLVLITTVSAGIAIQHKKGLLLPYLIGAFITLHLSYGCGSIAGFSRRLEHN